MFKKYFFGRPGFEPSIFGPKAKAPPLGRPGLNNNINDYINALVIAVVFLHYGYHLWTSASQRGANTFLMITRIATFYESSEL